MAGRRGFPWRWLIAGLAVSVVVLTIMIPPGEDVTADGPEEIGTEWRGPDETPHQGSTPDTVRVLVLNGTFINGHATRNQRRLLASSSDSTVIIAPYDPSDTPAEEKPYAQTIVISHLQDLSAAFFVADILGVPRDRIVWEVPQGGAFPAVDVTVCLGEDLSGGSDGE